MPLKNPKEKGNNHERKVAGLLSDWAGEKFMRTPASGAIHNFHDKRVVSDIVAPLSIGEWPFSIECKNTENSWEINTYIEGTATFWSQWKQCTDDAERESMLPMLVFTKNYRDIYMAITEDTFDKLELQTPPDRMILKKDGWSIIIMKFIEFLGQVDVKTLIEKLCK